MGLLTSALQLGRSVISKRASAWGGKVAQRYGGGAVAVGIGTAVGGAVGSRMGGGGWEDMGPARKRRKGLSGRDIQGAQRVMQLVSSFGYKPKLPCRRKARKCR